MFVVFIFDDALFVKTAPPWPEAYESCVFAFCAACGSLLARFKTKPLGSIPVSSEHEYSALSTRLSHDSHSKFTDEESMMIDACIYKKFVSNYKRMLLTRNSTEYQVLTAL
jgi:hypothetical protein